MTPTETSSEDEQMTRDLLLIITHDTPETGKAVEATGPAQVLMLAPTEPTGNIFKYVEDTMKVNC